MKLANICLLILNIRCHCFAICNCQKNTLASIKGIDHFRGKRCQSRQIWKWFSKVSCYFFQLSTENLHHKLKWTEHLFLFFNKVMTGVFHFNYYSSCFVFIVNLRSIKFRLTEHTHWLNFRINKKVQNMYVCNMIL